MSKKSWASIEGIVDVGPIVVAHCDNPCKDAMVEFLSGVFLGHPPAILPMSSILAAYHVLTRYLRVSRPDVLIALEKTLQIDSPAFFEEITRSQVLQALHFASINKVSSWDGFLLGIARQFGTRVIYSLDEQLDHVEGITVALPLPKEEIKKYHEWVRQIRAMISKDKHSKE